MHKSLRNIAVLGLMLVCLTSTARAGMNIENEAGELDGKYFVVFEDNKTKERSDSIPAELEGYYLTVHYKDGDVTYKLSEIYDRRTELEGSVYDHKTKSYKTVHLDDNSHFLHKDTQERMRQERLERQRLAKERIKARKKKKNVENGVPAPVTSPAPAANQN